MHNRSYNVGRFGIKTDTTIATIIIRTGCSSPGALQLGRSPRSADYGLVSSAGSSPGFQFASRAPPADTRQIIPSTARTQILKGELMVVLGLGIGHARRM